MRTWKKLIDHSSRNLTLTYWHVPEDVRFGGGGCREDFRQQCENRVERGKSRRCNMHTYERSDGYMCMLTHECARVILFRCSLQKYIK